MAAARMTLAEAESGTEGGSRLDMKNTNEGSDEDNDQVERTHES